MRPTIQRISPLWALAIAIFFAGDALTTAVGLQLGAIEANPMVSSSLRQYGLIGMLSIKIVAVAVIYQSGVWLDQQVTAVVALLSVSVGIVLWNSWIILQLV